MGCDIHLKTFVKSKVENKLVPLAAVVQDTNYFPLIVGDRDYSLFGLFGNHARSNYPEMDCFELDDLPADIKNSTFYKVFDCPDYHTRNWCYASKLKKSLTEYREALLDPKKWKEKFDEDSDWLTDIVEGKIPAEQFTEENKYLVTSIDDVLKQIKEVEDWVSDYADILDKDEIVFVTWMDS